MPSHPLTDFTLFPTLPPELRLKIWTISLLSTPHLINLYSFSKPIIPPSLPPPTSTSTSNPSEKYFPIFKPPHALLSTCSESRLLALQFHQPAFRYDAQGSITCHERNNHADGIKYGYVNFATDVMVISDYHLDWIPKAERGRIQNLIIRMRHELLHLLVEGDRFISLAAVLGMPALREVTVVKEMEEEEEEEEEEEGLEQWCGDQERLLREGLGRAGVDVGGDEEVGEGKGKGNAKGCCIRFLGERGLIGQAQDVSVVEGECTKAVWGEFVGWVEGECTKAVWGELVGWVEGSDWECA